jgi:hypothetical protein
MSFRPALPASLATTSLFGASALLFLLGTPACGSTPPTAGTGGAVGTGGALPSTGGGPATGGAAPGTGGSGSGGAPGTGGVGTGGASGGDSGSGGDVGSGGGGSLSLVLPIDVSATEFKLEFGSYKFAVDPTQGARITEFSLGGTNLITPVMVVGDALSGGSTFWTSPQADWSWPPIDAIDRSAYTATVTGSTIDLVGGAATVGAAMLHVEKAFTADLAAEAIDLVYEIHNDGGSAASLAPWEVSRLDRGGMTFWHGAKAPDAGARWDFEPTLVDGVYWWDDSLTAASELTDHKVSSDGEEGWVAHVDGDLLFIKSWTPVAVADIALDHGEVELYLGAGFIELEVQGPEADIAAAGSSTFTVRWYVRTLPVGTDVSVGSAALLAAVDAVLP